MATWFTVSGEKDNIINGVIRKIDKNKNRVFKLQLRQKQFGLRQNRNPEKNKKWLSQIMTEQMEYLGWAALVKPAQRCCKATAGTWNTRSDRISLEEYLKDANKNIPKFLTVHKNLNKAKPWRLNEKLTKCGIQGRLQSYRNKLRSLLINKHNQFF